MEATMQKIFIPFFISFMTFLGWQVGDAQRTIPNDQTHFRQVASPLTPLDIKVELNNQNKPPQIPEKKTVKQKIVTPPIILSPVETKITETEKKTREPASDIFILPLSFEERINKSVVNIYCIRPVTSGLEKITGSAVAIGSSGVYLTNAHVAVNIMLEKTNPLSVSCYIRTGSPATKTYKAEVVYLPESWVRNNSNFFTLSNPQGFGEKDYAIIRASESVGKNSPQPPLPFLEINTKDLSLGENIYLVGYPLNFTNANLLDSSLYKMTEKNSIKYLFDIGSKKNASLHTSPTLLAEKGSSGGAITNDRGELVGIMFATGVDNYSGGKIIEGITTAYIQNDLQNDTGHNLFWYIENAEEEAKSFSSRAQDFSAIFSN